MQDFKGVSPLTDGRNGASAAVSKNSQTDPVSGTVSDPDIPQGRSIENVTLSADNAEMRHSVATSQPGPIVDTQIGVRASSHLRNRRNVSSHNQVMYSHLINRFGVEQANHVARGFGWDITLIGEKEGPNEG